MQDPQHPERQRTEDFWDDFGRRMTDLFREMFTSQEEGIAQAQQGLDAQIRVDSLPEVSDDFGDVQPMDVNVEFDESQIPVAQEVASVEVDSSLVSQITTEGLPPVEASESLPPGLESMSADVIANADVPGADSFQVDFPAPPSDVGEGELPEVSVLGSTSALPSLDDFPLPEPSPSPLPEPGAAEIEEQFQAALRQTIQSPAVPPAPEFTDLPDALASPLGADDPVGFGALSKMLQQDRRAYDPISHQVQSSTAERDRQSRMLQETMLSGLERAMQDVVNLHQRAKSITTAYEVLPETMSDATV